MALVFGANSADEVDHQSNASLDDVNTGSSLAWIYADNLPSGSASTLETVWYKNQNTGQKTFRVNAADDLQVFINRPTTNLNVSADLATGFSTAFGASEWLCVAASWDDGGADGDQKLYCGNLATAIEEATSYSAQLVGSGTTTADASNNFFTGRAGSDVTSFDGRIGMLMVWNTVQTLDHLLSQQYRPHWSPDLQLWAHYGYQGATGTVLDLAGRGNTGTPTGTTLGNHVPIQPWVMAGGVTPYEVAGGFSNARAADMAFCRGRLPWGWGRLPQPDGTIG